MDEQQPSRPSVPQYLGDTPPPKYSRNTDSPPPKHNGPYSFEQRKQTVEAFSKSNMSIYDFSRVWGVGVQSLSIWLKRYQQDGPKGLESHKPGPQGRPRRPGMREMITGVKQQFPSFGLRKVRDFLYRFKGIKVSTGSVRNALREKGLNQPRARWKRQKIQPPRRFERSRPGELWQSDITSFVLARRKERVYLTVFLDDYSRYVVSWGLYLHQKQDIVTETLLDGIERFGKPLEVLTDQGRQYFSWRGKGDFQKLLIREGIRHVVARTHHPQTVGKTERFWATVGEEFWERIQPQDFTEAKERFGHFVAHYNHFRPHQGIDGMVPADRFFGVENQVREALEKAMSRNELHLALGEQARKPVFLVGQIGDQQVSLHGEKGRLIFQTQDGNVGEMGLEGLGAPGGKDGERKEQPGGGSITEEAKETASQKPEIQVAQERTRAGESAVGLSHGGREAESASGGGGDIGKLDGPIHPEGSGREAGGSAAEGLADVPASPGGFSGGASETAKGQEITATACPAAGGGSEPTEEKNSLPGEGLVHDEGLSGPVEGIPGSSGGEICS